MKMVIGGAYQGKRAFAAEHFGLDPAKMADGENASLDEILHAESVCNFHLFVAQCVKNEVPAAETVQRIIDQNPSLVVINNEVGYGLVPIDRFERAWREAVGRCGTMIASASDEVWRVMCGIGTCIKCTAPEGDR